MTGRFVRKKENKTKITRELVRVSSRVGWCACDGVSFVYLGAGKGLFECGGFVVESVLPFEEISNSFK